MKTHSNPDEIFVKINSSLDDNYRSNDNTNPSENIEDYFNDYHPQVPTSRSVHQIPYSSEVPSGPEESHAIGNFPEEGSIHSNQKSNHNKLARPTQLSTLNTY